MGNCSSSLSPGSPKRISPTAFLHPHTAVTRKEENGSILSRVSLRLSRHRISSSYLSNHEQRSVSRACDNPQYLEEVTSLRHSIRANGTIQPQQKIVFVLFAPPEYPTTNAAEYLSKKINLPVIFPHEYLTELENHQRVQHLTNVSTRTLLRKSSSYHENMTRDLLWERINQDDCERGFILFEYPDTITEMKYFKSQMVPQMRVELIFLQLNHEVMRHLQYKFDRWVHLRSGRSYHMIYRPPKTISVDLLPPSHENMIDDETGEQLEQLPDDLPEAYKAKLQQYQIKEIPMFYEFEECAHEVPGGVSEAEVHK
jgi:adenylate kinase